MNDDQDLSQGKIATELRQRLEDLRRAGVDRIALDIDFAPAPTRLRVRATASNATDSPAPVAALTEPHPTAILPVVKQAPPAVAASPAPLIPKTSPFLFNVDPVADPVVPPEDRPQQLATLASLVAGCERCPALVAYRTQTVFGAGSPTARLMFVGEAPGADEDRTGLPFVGRAGSLLTDMITKGMGLTRDEVYIANVVKSRPPENRNPLPDEIANCLPYLEQQISILRPEFLCLLGKVAASALLNTAMPLGKLRGRWHRVREIPTIVTYHPSFLLRNPSSKKDAWEDLQMLMKAMGLTPPGRKNP